MQRFHFLTGDNDFVEYGGKWYSRVNENFYYVIELLNWENSCGSKTATEIGAKYYVCLSEVSIKNQEDNINALKSCGWQQLGNGFANGLIVDEFGVSVCKAKYVQLYLVEALHGYGCFHILWDKDGNNWRELMKEARRMAQ